MEIDNKVWTEAQNRQLFQKLHCGNWSPWALALAPGKSVWGVPTFCGSK